MCCWPKPCTLAAGQFLLNFLRQSLAAGTQPCEQRWHHTISLRHQCRKQMNGLNLLILVARGDFCAFCTASCALTVIFFKSQHTFLVFLP